MPAPHNQRSHNLTQRATALRACQLLEAGKAKATAQASHGSGESCISTLARQTDTAIARGSEWALNNSAILAVKMLRDGKGWNLIDSDHSAASEACVETIARLTT